MKKWNGWTGYTSKTHSERPWEGELSKAEIIKQKETKIKLLEGQVSLLKKLEINIDCRMREFFFLCNFPHRY